MVLTRDGRLISAPVTPMVHWAKKSVMEMTVRPDLVATGLVKIMHEQNEYLNV